MNAQHTPFLRPAATHAMPFGARWREGTGVEFRLWAPAARSVELLHDAGGAPALRSTPAQPSPQGWWQVQAADATPSTRYQWQINGGLRVPDPAARHAPGGPHAPCVVTDPAAYAWHKPGWRGRPWQELVFYELHVGTFTHAGTYAAAQAELPRLAELGITAIELMPLATFGGAWGWGYDGVLPFAPHPAYGTPDELKHFVDAAHALDLCVFLDVVYNHFGPDGNYLNAYAPAFFSSTHDSPWGAAINFDGDGSAGVRSFFVHNALYWLEEFRFDGLRLDAVHAIADQSRPHILEDISNQVRALAHTTGRHLHLVLENEKNQPQWLAQPAGTPGRYDAQWNDDFHHALHVALTGESHTYYARFAEDPIALLGQALTRGFVFPDGRPAAPGSTPVPLSTLVNFLGNHDQVGNRAFGERLAALVPEAAAELALLLVLLTPSTPMVFMGDEFGATTPFLYFADWEGELRESVRAGRQREFGHVASPEHPLPDPCAAATRAQSRLDWAQCELPAGRARSALLQRALQVRREHFTPHTAQLQAGGHSFERVGATGLRVGWRYGEHGTLWLDANLGPEPLTAAPGAPRGTLIFEHRFDDAPPESPPRWAAWSARWILTDAAA